MQISYNCILIRNMQVPPQFNITNSLRTKDIFTSLFYLKKKKKKKKPDQTDCI